MGSATLLESGLAGGGGGARGVQGIRACGPSSGHLDSELRSRLGAKKGRSENVDEGWKAQGPGPGI